MINSGSSWNKSGIPILSFLMTEHLERNRQVRRKHIKIFHRDREVLSSRGQKERLDNKLLRIFTSTHNSPAFQIRLEGLCVCVELLKVEAGQVASKSTEVSRADGDWLSTCQGRTLSSGRAS